MKVDKVKKVNRLKGADAFIDDINDVNLSTPINNV